MAEIINNVGMTALSHMRLINRVRKTGEYEDNLRKYPIYSEFYGMLQTLKCMNISYDIEFSASDLYEMTAIVIMGIKFEV